MGALHTPGPWSWDTEAGFMGRDGSRTWCLLEGPEGDQGGSIFEGGFVLENQSTNLANAYLIAAAPDLLDAIKGARMAVEHLASLERIRGSTTATTAGVLRRIDAAISRALPGGEGK
jgi:hypothetical protein